MTKQFLPQLKEIKDPEIPPKGIKYLTTIEDSLNYPGRYHSFYNQNGYLSIVLHWVISPKNQPPFLATRQFDAPLSVLPWFVNKFEFFIIFHRYFASLWKIQTTSLTSLVLI